MILLMILINPVIILISEYLVYIPVGEYLNP